MFEAPLQHFDYLFIPICGGIKHDGWSARNSAVELRHTRWGWDGLITARQHQRHKSRFHNVCVCVCWGGGGYIINKAIL